MKAPIEPFSVVRILDEAYLRLHVAAETEEQLAQAEALLQASSKVKSLVMADQELKAAIDAMAEHYRVVAERGYIEAHMPDARELGERYVKAQIEQQRALECVVGGAG